ncbi:MAG: hypothetical protein ACLQDM_28810 [Bradyrhizobium sp.]
MARHGKRVGAELGPCHMILRALEDAKGSEQSRVRKLRRIGPGGISRNVETRKAPVKLYRAVNEEAELADLDIVPEIKAFAEVEILDVRA